MFDRMKSLIKVDKKTPGAAPSSPFVSISGTNPPVKGTKELLDLYSQSPWLRAVVGKVSRAVAETDWRLFVPTTGGEATLDQFVQRASFEKRREVLKRKIDQNEVEEVTTHALLDLLHVGNPDMLGHNALQVTESHIDIAGEAFWVMDLNGLGVPTAYWPVPPHWVRRLPSKLNPTYEISASNGQALDIPISRVIPFKDPDPSNPYGRGTGIARALGDELEIDEYSAKHMKGFFYNRARPDLIISGDNIGDADAKRLEESWVRKFGGYMRAYKPAFFSRKVDVKEVTQTFESMQMVPMRRYERDTFINVYGVPPEKLGVIGESKRSTISAADFFWTKDVIRPRVELLRRVLQIYLVPLFDGRLILDYDSPVVQDAEFELKVMSEAQHAFMLDEWRAKAGLKDLPDDKGKSFMVPLNSEIRPLEELQNNPEPEEAPTQEEPVSSSSSNKQIKKEVTSQLEEMLPEIKKEVKKLVEGDMI